jgi:hypothetical protein
LIRGEVWDRQEDLELKRQRARHVGKGPVGPQRLFENFSIGSFEVELRRAIRECERTIRKRTNPFVNLGLRVGFRGGSGSVND